jgi:hypothetical protein
MQVFAALFVKCDRIFAEIAHIYSFHPVHMSGEGTGHVKGDCTALVDGAFAEGSGIRR